MKQKTCGPGRPKEGKRTMKQEYIEIGKIVNTHGVRGEMKLDPWDVEAELLKRVKTLYIDGKAYKPSSARVHKNCLLLTFPEVADLDAALAFKGKMVSIRRRDVQLPDGQYFTAELMGLTALNAETGETLGTVRDVVPYPAHDVYVIDRAGGKEILVPAVPAFIQEIDMDAGTMKIHVWEGLI